MCKFIKLDYVIKFILLSTDTIVFIDVAVGTSIKTIQYDKYELYDNGCTCCFFTSLLFGIVKDFFKIYLECTRMNVG